MSLKSQPRLSRHHYRRDARASLSGFTLVEIMIVVLIIGVLLSIATPTFVHARDVGRARSCVYNLKEISTAKEEFALDTNLSPNSTYTFNWTSDISKYIRGPQPTCPANDPNIVRRTYVLGTVGQTVVCPYGAPASDPTLLHQYNF